MVTETKSSADSASNSNENTANKSAQVYVSEIEKYTTISAPVPVIVSELHKQTTGRTRMLTLVGRGDYVTILVFTQASGKEQATGATDSVLVFASELARNPTS